MNERPLEPEDDPIDYDRTEEQIEQARADEYDDILESIRKGIEEQFIEIARSQK